MLFSSPLFLFVFLPVLLGLYAVTRPRLSQSASSGIQPTFLYVGRVNLCLSHDCHHRNQLRAGTMGRLAPRGPVPQIRDRHGRHPQPGVADRFQIFKLPRRSVQSGAGDPARAAVEARSRAPAAGDLVLHLPCAVLRHRRVPAGRTERQAARLRALHDVIPSFDRRPDRALRRHRRTDCRAVRHDRGVRRGSEAVHHGAGQEDARGQHGRRRRRRHFRPPQPRFDLRPRLAGDRLLHPSDLLRLLRVLGHGHRPGEALRHRLPRELQLSLRGPVDHGVLEGAGISRCRDGSATTCTSPWEEIGSGGPGPTRTW